MARTNCSATPTATPPARVAGSDRIRASSDTTSTLSSSGSAMAAVPAWAALTPWRGASRMAVAAAKAPETVHTTVEVRRGDIPYRRAVSGLEAEARTASPKRVRAMNQARAAIRTGTTISTVISRAWSRMWAVGVHTASKGAPMGPGAITEGSDSLPKATILPSPTVAISSTSRGDRNSRRTTTSSAVMATAAPATTARAKASQ